MKRKLIKQGAGGLTLCLPKKWTDDNKLKAGQEIDLVEEEDRLVLSGKGVSEQKSITIKVTNTSKSVAKAIISNAYKKGYDTIHVKYDDEQVLRIIESVVNELMGYEIIDVKPGSSVIKNVSIELEQEYQNILRKSFFLCMENIRTITKDIEKKEYANKERIQEYRDLIAKYTDFCKRIINKNHKQKDYVIFEYIIIWTIEKISNELNYLYRYLAQFKPAVDKETLNYLQMSFKMFEQMIEYYFRKDVDYLKTFSKQKDVFFHEEFEKIMQKKSVDHNILHRIGNIIRRCQDMVGPFYGRYL